MKGMSKSEFERARRLASDMSAALAHVHLSTPLSYNDVECATGEMWDLILHLYRCGSEEEISRLHRLCKQVKEEGGHVRLERTLERMRAQRATAKQMWAEGERDAHRRFMTPMGPHVCPPGSMSENLPTNSTTARMSAGAVHRRSSAKPHTPQHPSVQKGTLCDSARNCGMMSQKSVSRTRRGGRRFQTDKKVRQLLEGAEATGRAIDDIMRRVGLRPTSTDK